MVHKNSNPFMAHEMVAELSILHKDNVLCHPVTEQHSKVTFSFSECWIFVGKRWKLFFCRFFAAWQQFKLWTDFRISFDVAQEPMLVFVDHSYETLTFKFSKQH